MATTKRTSSLKKPLTRAATRRVEKERAAKLTTLVELYMPPDERVLSMMTPSWLMAQIKYGEPPGSVGSCWQHTFNTTGKLRRQSKNLGSLRLQADDLLPSFKRFAGYRWREVHLAFNASPRARFTTLDANSSAAKRSKSASVYLYQIAAWLNADSLDRLEARTLDYQCSHLCNNRHCFSPDHVFLELAVDNQARETCRKAETFARDSEGGDVVGCAHGGEDRPYCVRSETSVVVIYEAGDKVEGRESSEGSKRVREGRAFGKRSK